MTGTRTLDVYELAYLAAGPRRAAESAVVALIEAGVLRLNHTTGEVILLEDRRCFGLEAAVLDVVGFRDLRMLGTVCWRLRADPRLTAIGQRLEAEGLLARGRGPESLRRRWWTMLSVSGAGRRVLRERRRDLASGGTDALRVALLGPAAMRNRGVYVDLFDPPCLVSAPRPRPTGPAGRSAGGYSHHGGAGFLGGGGDGGFAGDCGGGGDG